MSSKLEYFSVGNTIDGTNYCSGIESLSENLIEDNEQDATIIYPAKGKWASVRSSMYRLTTDNAEAVLPLPIYKINRVVIKPKNELVFISANLTLNEKELNIPLLEFINSKGESLYEGIDITNQIVNSQEWNALPIADSADVYKEIIAKDNTFYWVQNSNIITFSGGIYKIGTILPDKSPVYDRLLDKIAEDIRKSQYKYIHEYENGDTQIFMLHEDEGIDVSALLPYGDIRNWKYRIEYVPVSSKTKIRARKSAKTAIDYIQPFNQRAEINAASAFGKNMWLTAQKTGVKTTTFCQRYFLLSEIPPIGSLVTHNGRRYRTTINHYKMTNTQYVQVTHTLSENWTCKSKHVAVDQKYRNWKIPQDMLWRNLYWEDFVTFSHNVPKPDKKGGIAVHEIVQMLNPNTTEDKTIDAFCWLFDNAPKGLGVTLPCATYGMANSLIFSATMQDTLSAGLNRLSDYTCEESLYCHEDGTLEKARVILSSRTGNGLLSDNGTLNEQISDDDASVLESSAEYALPLIARRAKTDGTEYVINYPADKIFNKEFCILKDAGEALKFTYQMHFVAEDPNIVVGEAFTSKHPLVHPYDKKRSLWAFLSTKHLREGEELVVYGEKVSGSVNETLDIFTANYKDRTIKFAELKENLPPIFVDEFSSYARISLTGALLNTIKNASEYVAWGIMDEDGKLIVGSNDRTNTDIYVSVTHKR
jgi:hypothetical protein